MSPLRRQEAQGDLRSRATVWASGRRAACAALVIGNNLFSILAGKPLINWSTDPEPAK